MADLVAQVASISPQARLADSCRIVADRVDIEAGVRVGENVSIVAGEVVLRTGSEIRDGVAVTAIDMLDLGPGSVLGSQMRAAGRSLVFGRQFWSTSGVVIGGGGSQGPDSTLTVGDSSSFFDGAYVNLSEHVSIGSGCALSAETTILTHGCWQPVLEGYPYSFAPVTLEDDVVVFVKSSVMPGVTLRRGTTVAAGSVVVTDTPAFSLVGGVPAKVIKADARRRLTFLDRRDIVCSTLRRYAQTLEWKGVHLDQIAPDGGALHVSLGTSTASITVSEESPLRVHIASTPEGYTVLDLEEMTLDGPSSSVIEDLRDFLRRSGMKIATEARFQPLPPIRLAQLQRLGRKETRQ
jgi:acetyltransferase-like isoleucine patch superfamily enzyme